MGGVAYELVLERLEKRYGTISAVRDVSLSVAPGELVTLLGPSGSGKTTTLSMIAGFIYPTSGRILRGDMEITYMPPHLRNIGMVFQDYALFPHLSVFDNVAFPLRQRKVKNGEVKQKVDAALSLVRLEAMASRKPAELSGGQQQRVALARALVFGPSLLLMDEPLGALDKALREQMQLEIKRIQKATGVSIVHVTHDQQEALALSDRVVVMEGGCVRADGVPSEIYQRPRDRFVAEFVGETNLLAGTVVSKNGTHYDVRIDDNLVAAVASETGLADGSEVLLSLRPERVRCPCSGAANLWNGVVTDVVYTGEIVKYRVNLKDAPQISISAKRLASASAPLVAGEQVAVGWEAADAWILR